MSQHIEDNYNEIGTLLEKGLRGGAYGIEEARLVIKAFDGLNKNLTRLIELEKVQNDLYETQAMLHAQMGLDEAEKENTIEVAGTKDKIIKRKQ